MKPTTSTSKVRPSFAVLFDMDGVVVDNMKFHTKAWDTFLIKYGFSPRDPKIKHLFMGGRVNQEILPALFQKNLSKQQIAYYEGIKESLYRKLFRPYARPVAGLKIFLERLRKDNIVIALSTAAPPDNVSFILGATKFRKYFPIIVDSRGIKRGKPNPEIFLKTAKRATIPSHRCIVVEDSPLGIEAARRAKMKTVGITTTHSRKELAHANLIIKDFRGLTPQKFQRLLEKS